MTPKGAAVLPRPFCCPFCCFPSHPSSRSPCPATCCQLFADFRRRRRQLFVNFYPRPLGKSWLFVNFLRHFAQCPATYCQLFADFRRRRRQLFVNFYPRPPRAKFTFCQLLPAPRFGKVGILSTFGDTLRTCGALFVTFCSHFCRMSAFFANFNFTSAGL